MKKKFYIYQEDLIKYQVAYEAIGISQFVEALNDMFCVNGMKKLRTNQITDFLLKQGYLYFDEDEERKRPTLKGKMLGIQIGQTKDENGKTIRVNLYNARAQQYILDRFYDIILK